MREKGEGKIDKGRGKERDSNILLLSALVTVICFLYYCCLLYTSFGRPR